MRCRSTCAIWRRSNGAWLTRRAITGRIDILVNNAGINVRKFAFDVTEADWDAVLDVNLKGVFFVAQAVGKVMRDQQPSGGSIVNMSSVMGLIGYFQRAAYCSSKAAVVNLTRVLAVEWAEHGIRVNAVCPTFVDTPLTRPMFESQPEFTADVMRRTLLGRLATPEEIAAAVVLPGRSGRGDGPWPCPRRRRWLDRDLIRRNGKAQKRAAGFDCFSNRAGFVRAVNPGLEHLRRAEHGRGRREETGRQRIPELVEVRVAQRRGAGLGR